MPLSAGTLNLRFMQNARPAQDQDGWQLVSQVGGGAACVPPLSPASVTHETSYLPFLFPSPSSSDALPPRGRRTFNKRGEETTHQASSPAPPQNIVQQATEQTNKTRPHAISSSGAAPRQPKKSNKLPNKTARNLIFDTTGVGTDLRQSSSIKATPFLRPSGVDGPADPAKTPGATSSPNSIVKRSRAAGEADTPKKKAKLTLID